MKTFEFVMCTGKPGRIEADSLDEVGGLVAFLRGDEPVGILASGTWQSVFEVSPPPESEADRTDDGA